LSEATDNLTGYRDFSSLSKLLDPSNGFLFADKCFHFRIEYQVWCPSPEWPEFYLGNHEEEDDDEGDEGDENQDEDDEDEEDEDEDVVEEENVEKSIGSEGLEGALNQTFGFLSGLIKTATQDEKEEEKMEKKSKRRWKEVLRLLKSSTPLHLAAKEDIPGTSIPLLLLLLSSFSFTSCSPRCDGGLLSP